MYIYDEIWGIIEKYGFPQEMQLPDSHPWPDDFPWWKPTYVEVQIWSDEPINKYRK